MRRHIAYIHGLRRIGRAKALAGWQMDFRAEWLDLGKTDEHRLVEKELEWLRKPKKTKGRTERLTQIEEEKNRPGGKYVTDINRWTCSCPSYLISRFLLCKHLVRAANTILDDKPFDSLDFFFNLWRNHYPPYYLVSGIHADTEIVETTPSDSTTDTNIRVLGFGNELFRNGISENGEINKESDLTSEAFTNGPEKKEGQGVESANIEMGDNDSEIHADEREFVDPDSSHEEGQVKRVSWP